MTKKIITNSDKSKSSTKDASVKVYDDEWVTDWSDAITPTDEMFHHPQKILDYFKNK